jgi:glycerophosphoryl diester phosphodiesterase
MTLAELKELDAGSWKGPQFKGERIPTLEEGLATVPKGKGILLEIKDDARIIEPLAEVLSKTSLAREQIIIIGFDRDVVQAAKKRLPEYKVLWLVAFKKDKQTGAWSPEIDDVIADAQSAGVDGLDIRADPIVNREFVDKARAAKLPLFYVWTVNDPQVAAAMRAAGVNGITTDKPAELRRELEKAAK